MKKILPAAVLFFFFSTAWAQPADWYVAISAGAGWGGPKSSIKNKFEKTGFNQTGTSDFLGFVSHTTYPDVEMGVPVILRAGKRLKGSKSIFMLAGSSAASEVTGFKRQGYDSFLGLFGGSYGQKVAIRYNITQLAVGIEHTIKNSRFKLGYAAAAYRLRYHNRYGVDAGKKTALVPGGVITGRVPLGKERRRVGIELMADINVAPRVTLKAQQLKTQDVDGNFTVIHVMAPAKVNMVHGMAGLALTFRKK